MTIEQKAKTKNMYYKLTPISEEPPPLGEPIICFDENGITDRYIFPSVASVENATKNWDLTHWLKLSALPEVERLREALRLLPDAMENVMRRYSDGDEGYYGLPESKFFDVIDSTTKMLAAALSTDQNKEGRV